MYLLILEIMTLWLGFLRIPPVAEADPTVFLVKLLT